MKKNIKNKNENLMPILFAMLPLTAFALYILHMVSGYNNSSGAPYITFNSTYPLIILGEYVLITVLLFPFILNSKKEPRLSLYILPLMLFSGMGMMRFDSESAIKVERLDNSTPIMFLILFITLLLMAFSGHTLTGAVGIITGTAIYPVFALSFVPFITAAAFLFGKEKQKEHLISLILNSVLSAGAFIYGALKLDVTDIAFNKKYIPVILLVLACAVFFLYKKEYKLLPLSLLPLFPLAAGIIFGGFPTVLFTMIASVAPFVILLGTAALKGENEKIKGYAKELSHNPVIYIIVAVFILHTAGAMFVNPGFFYGNYV